MQRSGNCCGGGKLRAEEPFGQRDDFRAPARHSRAQKADRQTAMQASESGGLFRFMSLVGLLWENFSTLDPMIKWILIDWGK